MLVFLPCLCRVFAVSLLCLALFLPCRGHCLAGFCSVFAVSLPCLCRAFALYERCFCRVFAVSLPCLCRGLAACCCVIVVTLPSHCCVPAVALPYGNGYVPDLECTFCTKACEDWCLRILDLPNGHPESFLTEPTQTTSNATR